MFDPSKYSVAEQISIIFSCRDAIEETAGFDILDNQNYNTFQLMQVMESVDPSFAISVKRNGTDYTTVDRGMVRNGEMKGTKCVPGSKAKKSFSFHAYAVLNNEPEEMFLFYTHYRGVPQRIYDIRCPRKVAAINDHLTEKANKWASEVSRGTKNGKFDMISVPEKFVHGLFDNHYFWEIGTDGALVEATSTFFDWTGRPSIYSDFVIS